MEFFTHPDKLNPMDIANKEANPDKTPQYSVDKPPISTQTYLLHSPSLDASEPLVLPLPRLYVYARSTDRLVSDRYLTGVHLTARYGAIFGVY